MIGPFLNGLYRFIDEETKSYRFFRVYKSSQGFWKVREYRNGDLNQELPTKTELTEEFWEKLEYWQ